jgi:hypothetical protein
MSASIKDCLSKFRLYRELAYLIAYVAVTGKYVVDLAVCGWGGMLDGFDNATHDWRRQVFIVGWARGKIEKNADEQKGNRRD